MKPSRAVAAVGGTGLVGYAVGRLTAGDLAGLLGKIIDGTFTFLKQQGEFASYTIIVAGGCVSFILWAMKFITKTMQAEINRIAGERDKLQQVIIEGWRSSGSTSEKGGKKK